MNPLFMFIIIATVLLLAALAWIVKRPRVEYFANGKIVNITPKGRCTRLADNAFTQRYLLAKPGSDASHIDICTAADRPIGVVPDMTPTTDTDTSYPLPVNLLGLNEDTERMIASGAIGLTDTVVADAGGKVAALPAAAGSYWVVGIPLSTTTADGDQIEVVPCVPYKVTVA